MWTLAVTRGTKIFFLKAFDSLLSGPFGEEVALSWNHEIISFMQAVCTTGADGENKASIAGFFTSVRRMVNKWLSQQFFDGYDLTLVVKQCQAAASSEGSAPCNLMRQLEAIEEVQKKAKSGDDDELEICMESSDEEEMRKKDAQKKKQADKKGERVDWKDFENRMLSVMDVYRVAADVREKKSEIAEIITDKVINNFNS
mgnify:CR=1 FL=1